MMTEDERFMKAALVQARKAEALEETPIGCVIVCDGKIIARGYNRRNTDKNTTSHAEINAIRKASRKLGDWRLEGCTIYITLEPCQMCAGAIVQARITRAVIGAMNPKAGCAGSVLNILQDERFNHQVEVTSGVLEAECSEILSSFFRKLRHRCYFFEFLGRIASVRTVAMQNCLDIIIDMFSLLACFALFGQGLLFSWSVFCPRNSKN